MATALRMSFCFCFFVMHICVAKFQEHCFNISRDIVYSIFSTLSCKQYDVITDLICLFCLLKTISLNEFMISGSVC